MLYDSSHCAVSMPDALPEVDWQTWGTVQLHYGFVQPSISLSIAVASRTGPRPYSGEYSGRVPVPNFTPHTAIIHVTTAMVLWSLP